MVIRKGSVYVTTGTDRRTSGTHYTPTSLTEPIVKHTLDPLCYIGPAEGRPEGEWQLRSAKELLDLKICDMACGSGAFLVQACRYLSELLVEAWEQAAEKTGGGKPVKDLRITPYGEPSTGAPDEQLIPLDTEERLVYARRLVAQRCLYGVDKNPLAVEMAKLSLWLLTLAKDKPFTFLDHCIRAGDSLVGISSIEQLLRFSLDERVSTGPLLEQQRKQIEKRLDAVKTLRTQIEELPSNTPLDIERKAAMLKNADEQIRRLTYAADMLLAESWQPMSAAEREAALNSTLVQVEYKFKDLPVEELDAEAKKKLRNVGVSERFHWPLEFPEVFERGGFGAFVCNPPFMGNKKITGEFGDPYRDNLVNAVAHGQRGLADLCAYFFLRANALKRRDGAFGFVATNKIAEGGTREVGLDQIVHQGSCIYRAVRNRVWPGTANVVVSLVWIHGSAWNGRYCLDERQVAGITSLLSEVGDQSGNPKFIVASQGIGFIGSVLLGTGFILTPEHAEDLIAGNARNRDVILPYLGGEDLNTSPTQSASRYVIQFSDWPLARTGDFRTRKEPVASDYPDCLSIVERLVKPERDQKNRKTYRENWWRFAELQKNTYESIKDAPYVLIKARVSPIHALVFVPNGQVFSEQTVVFKSTYVIFQVLQSSLHEAWAIEYSTSKGTSTLVYAPQACVTTFPFPPIAFDASEGRSFHEHRRVVMEKRHEGLTKVYNRLHNPEESAADIQELRDLHVEVDNAVAAAYGWDDLDLSHGFHMTKQGGRFTISETARREVLQRLLKLNHERYAEEVKQGLHKKKGGARKAPKPTTSAPGQSEFTFAEAKDYDDEEG